LQKSHNFIELEGIDPAIAEKIAIVW